MQDTIDWLIEERGLLWVVFGSGVANVLFAIVFGSRMDRWIETLMHSPRIKKARKESKFVESYCRFVKRFPLKPVTVIFGFFLMALALVGWAAW